MTITTTSIANSALRKLGLPRITSLSENSSVARTLNDSYATIKLAELEKHPWRFAMKRLEIAPSATALVFGTKNRFPLPPNCARVLRDEANLADEFEMIEIEDGHYLSYGNVARLVYTHTDVSEDDYPATFAEALAYRLAIDCAEQLTKSSPKMTKVQAGYDELIATAKRNQAIERRFDPGTPDVFELARL